MLPEKESPRKQVRSQLSLGILGDYGRMEHLRLDPCLCEKLSASCRSGALSQLSVRRAPKVAGIDRCGSGLVTLLEPAPVCVYG